MIEFLFSKPKNLKLDLNTFDLQFLEKFINVQYSVLQNRNEISARNEISVHNLNIQNLEFENKQQWKFFLKQLLIYNQVEQVELYFVDYESQHIYVTSLQYDGNYGEFFSSFYYHDPNLFTNQIVYEKNTCLNIFCFKKKHIKSIFNIQYHNENYDFILKRSFYIPENKFL